MYGEFSVFRISEQFASNEMKQPATTRKLVTEVVPSSVGLPLETGLRNNFVGLETHFLSLFRVLIPSCERNVQFSTVRFKFFKPLTDESMPWAVFFVGWVEGICSGSKFVRHGLSLSKAIVSLLFPSTRLSLRYPLRPTFAF